MTEAPPPTLAQTAHLWGPWLLPWLQTPPVPRPAVLTRFSSRAGASGSLIGGV